MGDLTRQTDALPIGEKIVMTEQAFESASLGDARTGTDPFPVLMRGVRIMFVVTFIAVALGAIVAGVSGIRFVADADARSTEAQLIHGVLANAIRGNDVPGFASVGQGPEGDSLVISRTPPASSEVYETRFYLYQGNVMQEVAAASRAYDPRGATRLVRSESFDVTVGDGVIRVMTDRDSVTVAMRCGDAPVDKPVTETPGQAPSIEGGAS